MSDLKEFWDNFEKETSNRIPSRIEFIKRWRMAQGLFFWERGGKQFARAHLKIHIGVGLQYRFRELDSYISLANTILKEPNYYHPIDAQNFLDCVACLGEERVKQLIKELEKEGKE